MAKVMISLPDKLLERIDAQARAERSTRSGFLRALAEKRLAEENAARSAEIERLLGPPMRFGGDAVRLIREDRESH